MAEEAAVVETPTPESSMDDTIRETYRAQQEASPNGDVSGQDSEEITENLDAGQESAETTGNRDERGRFKAKDAQADEAEPELEEAVEASVEDDYPSSWKGTLREKWGTVDPEVKAEIKRREQNFLDGIKQYKEPAAFGNAIGNEMMPYLDTIRQIGQTPQTITRELFSTWNTLVTGSPDQKQATLLNLAQAFGINMSSGSSTPQKDAGSDPNSQIAALQQQIAELRRSQETFSQQQERLAREAEQAEQAEIDADIARFAADPKNEHFESVKQIMGRLMTAGQAETLQEAYEQACRIHPEVFSKLQAKTEAERRKREAEQAAAAKRAAAPNVNRRGTHPETPKPGSMQDTIKAEAKRLGMI